MHGHVTIYGHTHGHMTIYGYTHGHIWPLADIPIAAPHEVLSSKGCQRGVRGVTKWCQSGVRAVSEGCQRGDKGVSEGCHMRIRWVSEGHTPHEVQHHQQVVPCRTVGWCQMSVGWISDRCPIGVTRCWMGAKGVLDGWRIGARWVSNGCLIDVRWVSEGCRYLTIFPKAPGSVPL